MTVDRTPVVRASVCDEAPDVAPAYDCDLVAWYPLLQRGCALIDLPLPPGDWVRVRVDLLTGSAWSVVGDGKWWIGYLVKAVVETLNDAFPGIGEMPGWALHLCDVLSAWVERSAEPIPATWLPVSA